MAKHVPNYGDPRHDETRMKQTRPHWTSSVGQAVPPKVRHGAAHHAGRHHGGQVRGGQARAPGDHAQDEPAAARDEPEHADDAEERAAAARARRHRVHRHKMKGSVVNGQLETNIIWNSRALSHSLALFFWVII